MARLRAVPDIPLRAVAYVRVSDEGGRGDQLLSPEIQLAAISDHCARLGYTLVETLEDIDLSGRFWKRRQVEHAIGMIERREADVLVVWKISRVARNRKDWAIAVDRIESIGGHLESATEPNERTASGRFARGMLAELAAFESERIGETWQEVHARRLASGRPANGKPRWGYAYDPAGKVHRPDPITGPVLADLYRRYVGGESIYTLVRWLNDAGYRTAPGYTRGGEGVWSDRTLRRMLDSGFGAGLLTVAGAHQPGVHEPVVDADLWAEYQAARVARATGGGGERSQYVLSGLVRCSCGSSMTGGQFGHQRQPKYRCKAAKEQGRHDGGYVTMAFVEAAVLAWLATEAAADVDDAARRAASQVDAAARSRTDAAILARRVLEVDRQMEELTRQLVRGVIPEAAYATVRDELAGDRARLVQAQATAQVSSRHAEVAPLALALVDGWDTLGVEVRRGMLRQLVRRVVVTPGRPRGIIEVVPVWAPDGAGDAAA